MFAVFFLLFAVLSVIANGATKAKPTRTPTVAPNPNVVTYDF